MEESEKALWAVFLTICVLAGLFAHTGFMLGTLAYVARMIVLNAHENDLLNQTKGDSHV